MKTRPYPKITLFLLFTACQKSFSLLKTSQEMEESPFPGNWILRLPARWSIEFFQIPQLPGDLLLWWKGSLGRAICCGLPPQGHKMQHV
jgi:hypothetical protein